jgi:hypothetical protein
MTSNDAVLSLKNEVELMQKRRSRLCRLARRVLLDAEFNQLADEARTALTDSEDSLDELIEAMTLAGTPYEPRALDQTTAYDRRKIRENLREFLSVALGTLAVTDLDEEPLPGAEPPGDDQELSAVHDGEVVDLGPGLGGDWWGADGAWDIEEDAEELDVPKLTVQVVSDTRRAFALVTTSLKEATVKIFAARLVELAGHSVPRGSENPDQARLERVRRYEKEVARRQRRKSGT